MKYLLIKNFEKMSRLGKITYFWNVQRHQKSFEWRRSCWWRWRRFRCQEEWKERRKKGNWYRPGFINLPNQSFTDEPAWTWYNSQFGALKGEKVQEKNQETKKDGGIGFKNFWNYIKASDTLFMFFLWIILKLGSVSLFVLSDLQYSKIGDVVEGKIS